MAVGEHSSVKSVEFIWKETQQQSILAVKESSNKEKIIIISKNKVMRFLSTKKRLLFLNGWSIN